MAASREMVNQLLAMAARARLDVVGMNVEPKAIVDLLLDILLQGEVSPKAKDKLVAFMEDAKPDDKERDNRIRETAHAIMTMPEYQLC